MGCSRERLIESQKRRKKRSVLWRVSHYFVIIIPCPSPFCSFNYEGCPNIYSLSTSHAMSTRVMHKNIKVLQAFNQLVILDKVQ